MLSEQPPHCTGKGNTVVAIPTVEDSLLSAAGLRNVPDGMGSVCGEFRIWHGD